MANNVTHHEPPIEYPAAPDVLQTAKDYDPGESDKTMMTVRRFPVFLRQGLEALSREPDGGGSMERTVDAHHAATPHTPLPRPSAASAS